MPGDNWSGGNIDGWLPTRNNGNYELAVRVNRWMVNHWHRFPLDSIDCHHLCHRSIWVEYFGISVTIFPTKIGLRIDELAGTETIASNLKLTVKIGGIRFQNWSIWHKVKFANQKKWNRLNLVSNGHFLQAFQSKLVKIGGNGFQNWLFSA